MTPNLLLLVYSFYLYHYSSQSLGQLLIQLQKVEYSNRHLDQRAADLDIAAVLFIAVSSAPSTPFCNTDKLLIVLL